jgi:hypothetical protein
MNTKTKPTKKAAATPEAPQEIEETIRCERCGTVTVYSNNLCEDCFRREYDVAPAPEAPQLPTQQDKDQLEMAREILALRATAAKLAEAGNKLASMAWSDASDDELEAAVSEWKSALAEWEAGQ